LLLHDGGFGIPFVFKYLPGGFGMLDRLGPVPELLEHNTHVPEGAPLEVRVADLACYRQSLCLAVHRSAAFTQLQMCFSYVAEDCRFPATVTETADKGQQLLVISEAAADIS
jgi:hypothetical protein